MSEGYTDDKVKQITQEAYEQAQRLGMSSRGAHNGELDAFRHAYASARMTQEWGESLARKGGFRHEQNHPNEMSEHVMDLYNNEFGRNVAKENLSASTEELANKIYQQGIKQGGLITSLDDSRIETYKEKYTKEMESYWLLTDHNGKTQSSVELSSVAQTIKQQCHSHVYGFCERNNQPWTEGMDNTVMSLTVVAREAQMSGVDALGVSQGTIYIAQTDRKGIYREAEINSLEAANIPMAQSEQRLAIVDQQMLAQEQQQAIDNLAQTQHKVHSGPRMG
jgi:hypothetical protein